MNVVVVGLNFRSCPLPILERVSIPRELLDKSLRALVKRDNVSEAVIVSTCLRTEVYVVAERFHGAIGDINEFLASVAGSMSTGMTADEIGDYSYSYYDEGAVSHLFRVAAGLDSAVLGEGEILGQLKGAWEQSTASHCAGPILQPLFRHAIEVGKKSRTETAIARGITSVPQAALVLAARRLEGGLNGRNVVVIGAGDVGSAIANSIADSYAPSSLTVVSKSYSRAEQLGERIGERLFASGCPVHPADLSGLGEAVNGADVVFSGTASSSIVLDSSIISNPSGRHLLLVDVAVPRDIDPAAREIEGVELLDMDAIRSFAEEGVASRMAEVSQVKEIVAEEVSNFMASAAARKAAPLIIALRERAEEIRSAEVAKFSKKSSGLDEAQANSVDALTKSIVAKLLHDPTVKLKEASGTPKGERLGEAVQALFDI